VDRRFPASSYLRFLTFVYNSARAPVSGSSLTESTGTNSGSQSGAATGQPDLAVQVQVFRDDQPVITTPLSKINTEGTADLQRIPYAADVRLENLPPGAYLLHVTVIDRVAKTSVSQRINFEIE
jgi:hypothetical protein